MSDVFVFPDLEPLLEDDSAAQYPNSSELIDYLKNDESFKKMIFEILDRESFKTRKIWNADKIRKQFENVGDNKEFPYWRIINLEIWANAYGVQNL